VTHLGAGDFLWLEKLSNISEDFSKFGGFLSIQQVKSKVRIMLCK